RVGMCFNFPDPILPNCSSGIYKMVAYNLSRPRATSRKVADQVNAQNLLNLMIDLGPGSQGGPRNSTIFFTPPFSDTRSSATPELNVEILPGKRFGKQRIRGISTFDAGPPDAGGDSLRVLCLPAL